MIINYKVRIRNIITREFKSAEDDVFFELDRHTPVWTGYTNKNWVAVEDLADAQDSDPSIRPLSPERDSNRKIVQGEDNRDAARDIGASFFEIPNALTFTIVNTAVNIDNGNLLVSDLDSGLAPFEAGNKRGKGMIQRIYDGLEEVYEDSAIEIQRKLDTLNLEI